MSCADCSLFPVEPMSNSGGFEGPEKHLELDFRPLTSRSVSPTSSGSDLLRSRGASEGEDLTQLNDEDWAPVLQAAAVNVLSIVSSSSLKMFLLSESSMFVNPRKVVLKTCGTTRLLCAIPHILKLAQSVGLECEFVAFHRRNYIFPHAQLIPHRTFPMEVSYLQQYFPEGKGVVIGPSEAPHTHLFVCDRTHPEDVHDSADVTIEVTMTKLPVESMSHFFREKHPKEFALTPAHYTVENEMFASSVEEPPEFVTLSPTVTNDSQTWLSTPMIPGSHRWTPASPGSDRGFPIFRADCTSTPPVSEDPECATEVSISQAGDGVLTLTDAVVDQEYCEVLKKKAPCFFSQPREEIVQSKALGAKVTKLSKIDTLVPSSVIDSYMFNPCGYSMNGLVLEAACDKYKGPDRFWTMHITPEDHCSFVSFELTLPLRCYHSTVMRVLNVFKPGEAIIRVFADQSVCHAHSALAHDKLEGYTTTDITAMSFDGPYGFLVLGVKPSSGEETAEPHRLQVVEVNPLKAGQRVPPCPDVAGMLEEAYTDDVARECAAACVMVEA